MSQQTIGLGTVANDGTGDDLRAAGDKINDNFTELYASIPTLGAGVATFLTTPSSANLSAAVTNETGTGALVFATSPTLVTPLLGTPTSGALTNCTGYPTSALSGLGAGVATFLATPSSANLAAAVTDETGTGGLVFANSPRFVDDITLGTESTTTGQVKLAHASSAFLTTIQAGNAAAARTYIWPTNVGAAGTVLTDAAGDGTLSWAAAGGGLPAGVTSPGTGQLAFAAGTITTSQPSLSVTQTWNAAGVAFTGIVSNITNTASAAASKLLDLQVDGTPAFSVTKTGKILTAIVGGYSPAVANLSMGDTNGGFSFSSGNMYYAVAGAARAVIGNDGVNVAVGGVFGFTAGAADAAAADSGFIRRAAGVAGVCDGTAGAGALQFSEQTAPVGAANSGRVYTQDNGSGKTQLMVIFGSGVGIQLAIEV